MSSPWDSQRHRPGEWSADEDTSAETWEAPPPPDYGREELSRPVETAPPEPGWPTVPGVGEPPTGRHEDRQAGRSAPGALKVPVVLLSVSLLAALLVFTGLRVVRINVSSGTASPSSVSQEIGITTIVGTAPSAIPTAPVEELETPSGADSDVDWSELSKSIVYFEVAGSCQWVGSGTLILDGSYVLTNWHVSGGGECPMRVGLTDSSSAPPREFYPATVVVWDSQIDLAIVRLQDSVGAPLIAPGRRPVVIAEAEVKLGETVRLLGYPVVREDQFESGQRYTLTLTDGSVSGTEDFGTRSTYNPTDSRKNDYEVWGEYIKHTAKQSSGVSGGGAFNTKGQLVAVPTAGGEKLELMRSVRFAKELIAQLPD